MLLIVGFYGLVQLRNVGSPKSVRIIYQNCCVDDLRHNCHRPLTRITSRTTHTLEGNGNDVQQGSATRSAWTTKVKQSAPFPRRICGTNNWGSCAAALEWQRQQWRRSSCLPAVVRKRPRRIPARRHRTSQHQRPHYNDAVPEVSVPL